MLKSIKVLLCLSFTLLNLTNSASSNEARFNSFEFRYYSQSEKANGETDFKGKTEVFDTNARIDFLNAYTDYASKYFNVPNLDAKAVYEEQISDVIKGIKAQPLSEVRRTIKLEDWKALGYRTGQEETEKAVIALWEKYPNAQAADNHLTVSAGRIDHKLDTGMNWRFKFRWQAGIEKNNNTSFCLSGSGKNILEVGFDKNGSIYIRKASEKTNIQSYKTGNNIEFTIEGDLENNFYNLYLDGKLVLYAEPMLEKAIEAVDTFSIATDDKVMIDKIFGYDYVRDMKNNRVPYSPRLVINNYFSIKPSIDQWQESGYNDDRWQSTTLPAVHGGFYGKEEDLYLRKKIRIGDYEKAILSFETIDPGGVVYINNKKAATINNRLPVSIDATPYLKKNAQNQIAVKVNSFRLNNPMLHSCADRYIGWFAGRCKLELTSAVNIDKILIHTEILDGSKATQRHKVALENSTDQEFTGKLEICYRPWYPEEGAEQLKQIFEIRIPAHQSIVQEHDTTLNNASLWTFKTPNLYKVQVLLKNDKGQPVDDIAATTGIRTVSQEGGTFRINSKEEILNGVQNMGFRMPFEDLAKNNRCAPLEVLVEELLMAKNCGSNAFRVHVHAALNTADGINDPRIAELCDQLGIMLIWQTGAWIREGSWEGIDLEGLPHYMEQVYNHPSIVVWELSNHPNKFKPEPVSNSFDFVRKTIQAATAVDTSRLISPTTFWQHTHIKNDAGTRDIHGNDITAPSEYTHPLCTRGTQDSLTGYGFDWYKVRNWPSGWSKDCLDNGQRAYFNWEHEESIAQPNWTLCKGKPWYQMQSYEWDYDNGSIGKKLDADQWRASQGFQAFSAYEAMKKQRMFGVSGFSWCCLHGGANSGTYKKPLIDCLGYPKLAWYIHKFIYQRVLAGSDNVDVVYGPDDTVTPVILNFDDAKVVGLTIKVRNQKNQVVKELSYPGITLGEGRSVTKLEPVKIDFPGEGYYAIEYIVERQDGKDISMTADFKEWSEKSQIMFPVKPITSGPLHHWFGYYDKFQTDPSDRYVLSMEVDFEHRTPTENDKIKIGMIDLNNNNKWTELGSSKAWNWQQGCMLQWRPGTNEVLWNDREQGKYVCRIVNVRTMEKRTIPYPIYTLSPDGKFALSTDFERIQDCRAGYGYPGISDRNNKVLAPEDAGIYKISLDDGSRKQIVSIKEIADIPYPVEKLSGYKHYFNHLDINTDGTRFVFLNRWVKPGEGRRISPLGTRMLTASVDGGEIHVLNDSKMTSHFWWKNAKQCLAYANRPESGNHFYLFDDVVEKSYSIEGKEVFNTDGHCSYLQNTDWIMNDTYPDGNRQITLYLYNTKTKQKIVLGKFFVDKKYQGEWRVDLHPRQSRDGKKIFVDCPIGKEGRQILMVDISELDL